MKQSRFVLALKDVRLRDVCSEVCETLLPMVGSNVQLINDVPADLPTIKGDARCLT